ncbi:hypothetical protein GGR54DRAFT_152326 [Hypoxylon sp. NC1633]|nr:hypothetical protein GGR54DRAFT_152326 [Hypoxylon sp. NC1633]
MLKAPYVYQDLEDLDENDKPIKKLQPPEWEDDVSKAKRFYTEVIKPLHKGNDPNFHAFGLDELRGAKSTSLNRYFDDKNHPKVFIFTPRPRADETSPTRDIPQNEGRWAYGKEITDLNAELDGIFGYKAPITIVDYYPIMTPLDWPDNDNEEAVSEYQSDKPGSQVSGKILIQYKPAPDCRGQASYRVWFEGALHEEKSWDPLAWRDGYQQIIPPLNNQKRDNGTSCKISSSSSSSSATASSTSVSSSPTTTPITTPTPIPTMVPASPESCYNSQKRGCYKAVDPATAYSKSDDFCNKHMSINGFKDWLGIQFAWNDFSNSTSYNWKVSWKPGCVAGQDSTEINVGQPIPMFSCEDAMRLVIEKCNNGFHGGTALAGCLMYSFSAVNMGDDVSCSSPFV